ncbi:MAG: protein kinase [Chloroflexota bacterium]
MAPRKFGRYEIKSELGRGGMALVFHSYDPHFKRDVALKVLPRDSLKDSTFRARFQREAEILAMLEHHAIVPVYDFGEEAGQPYLVMRYMQGGSLDARIKRPGLSLAEASTILERIGGALDRAHQQGIVHRDLKPENILLDQFGDVFLADFGIARLIAESRASLTGNAIIGTPFYMSPEQIHGDQEIDGRSDIYALGIILFKMLTGKLPYHSPTPSRVLMMHLLDPIPSICQIKKELPSEMETVIQRVLAKEPQNRYQSASTLIDAFMALPMHQTGSPTRVQPSEQIDPTLEETKTGSKTPLRVEKLDCPACGAPLPNNLSVNQQLTCASCDSSLIVTGEPLPDTIVCPNCQTLNRDQQLFCTNCHQSLQTECIMCHQQNPITQTHCLNCGADLERSRAARQELLEAYKQAEEERSQALKEKSARQRRTKIFQLLKDLEYPDKHDFAFYQLQQLEEDATGDLSEILMNHHQPGMRRNASKILESLFYNTKTGRLMKARIVKILIKAAADPHALVRLEIARILGGIKGPERKLVIDPLATLLKDPDKQVQKQAEQSLQMIGGKRAQEILNQSRGMGSWLKRR